MPFSVEDRYVIKCLRQNKNYSAKRLLKEFPTKGWTLGGLNDLIRKIDTSGTIARKAGSGRPRTIRTVDNIETVESLILSQDGAPQTHQTQRQVAHQTGISVGSVNAIVKRDLGLRCFKKYCSQELTAANKLARLQRCRRILRLYPSHAVEFIWFTDEKLFTVAAPSNSQNDRLYAAAGTRKRNIAPSRLLRTRPTFSRSLMVSVGVSALGRTAIHFVEPGTKINGRYYRDVLLSQKLLPDIRQFSDVYVFQQDGAPAHRARETVEFLTRETPAFIPPALWPPNSPDLNPVDYTVWSVMEEIVYRTNIQDVVQLRQRILEAWAQLDQRVIDAAIMQWRARLRACVAADGAHFEHTL
jgi:hypothetical protein